MENRHGGVQSLGAAIALFPESFFLFVSDRRGRTGRGAFLHGIALSVIQLWKGSGEREAISRLTMFWGVFFIP